MTSKQKDHNDGQREGARATWLNELFESLNPLSSPERRRGFRHARQQRLAKDATPPTEPHRDEATHIASGFGVGGGGFAVGGGAIRGLLASFSLATGVPWQAFILLVLCGLFMVWLHEEPPPHYALDIVVYDAALSHPTRFLDDQPGQKQRINLSVSLQGGLQYSRKPVTVTLLRDGNIVFNQQFKIEATSGSELSMPVEAELMPGRYLARVSADGIHPREYEFAVGANQGMVGGINLGDPSVQPASKNGISIFVTDSFQGSRPGPPKNVIYAVAGELTWLYAEIQSDASSGATTSVNATVMCGASPLLTQPAHLAQNSMVYFPMKQELTAGRCVERAFLSNGIYVEFPFIVVEVERGNSAGEYRRLRDPDAAPQDVSTAWLQQGLAHSGAGQHEAAIRDFSVAIQSNEINGYQLRANEYATLGDYERAIAVLTKMVYKYPAKFL